MNLNLGCGTAQRKGFTNVDNFVEGKKGYKFVKADIKAMPFENSSASYVEMMSVLEHISFREVVPVLNEIYRVMKLGAELVIRTENFDGLALDWIRMRMEPFNLNEYASVMEAVYGNQSNEGEFHKTAFTPEFLSGCLHNVGFKVKSIVNHPKDSPVPEFGTMPAIPKLFLRSDQLVATAIR